MRHPVGYPTLKRRGLEGSEATAWPQAKRSLREPWFPLYDKLSSLISNGAVSVRDILFNDAVVASE
jgi:hypothetical protein